MPCQRVALLRAVSPEPRPLGQTRCRHTGLRCACKYTSHPLRHFGPHRHRVAPYSCYRLPTTARAPLARPAGGYKKPCTQPQFWLQAPHRKVCLLRVENTHDAAAAAVGAAQKRLLTCVAGLQLSHTAYCRCCNSPQGLREPVALKCEARTQACALQLMHQRYWSMPCMFMSL